MKSNALILVLTIACGLMPGKPALAQEEVQEEIKVKFSTGADYSTGDYGRATETQTWYYPASVKVTDGNWSAKVTVPYLYMKGPAGVLGGGDTVVVCDDNSGSGKGGGCPPVDPNAITTREGLGDIIGALTYTIDLEDYDFYLDFTGKIKVPTADEDKGLGTGETDYTARVDATKMFGSAYIFGGFGRRFVGDNPQLQFKDIWLYNAGAGYQVTKNFGIGAAYDFRESPSTAEDPSEASVYFTYKITNTFRAMLYGVIGFSDGSPDEGAGAQLSINF
jgi:hypothetical protein